MMDAGDVLAPGTRLDGLEIQKDLGAGGFGITYLARDRSLDVWRAVKEYLPRDWGTRRGDGTVGPRTGSDAGDYRWGLERFLEEARILARFDHRSLVRVYRSFKARGTAYMVMEYVEGRTLEEEVEASEPWPASRVREVLAQLMDGLEKVHGAEVWHRDIKPKNVMVRPNGTPVLIDFGAARQAIGGHSGALTAVLTPGYAPIEQYSPRGHQGPWTDIYALGATAYWALSGEVPAEAGERVQADRLLPVAQVARVLVSARLAAAVDAALSVYAADRPQSLEEWRAMLDRPVHVRPPGPPPGAGRSVGAETGAESSGQGGAKRRRRLGVVAAGLAIAALVAALAVALIVLTDGSVPEERDQATTEAMEEKPADAETVRTSPPAVLEGSALVVVETTPPGAEVLVDGTRVGVTPLERSDIRAGVREVTLRHPHYETVSIPDRNLEDGVVLRVERVLQRGAGRLTVTVTPREAWVEVDGERRAERTPVTLQDLPAGPVEVRLGAPEHRPLAVEVEIPKDGLARLERTLRPIPYGSLTLELEPPDATVTLPDVELRYQPGVRLPEGAHRVVVRSEAIWRLCTRLTCRGTRGFGLRCRCGPGPRGCSTGWSSSGARQGSSGWAASRVATARTTSNQCMRCGSAAVSGWASTR